MTVQLVRIVHYPGVSRSSLSLFMYLFIDFFFFFFLVFAADIQEAIPKPKSSCVPKPIPVFSALCSPQDTLSLLFSDRRRRHRHRHQPLNPLVG